MKAFLLFVFAGAAALLPALAARASKVSGSASVPASLFGDFSVFGVSEWTPAPAAFPYLFAVDNTEQKYGIPHNLLARQIEQESAWNPKAFNPGSQASGIAQIVPKWHPNVNPWEPFAAIDYAGFYMAQNFKRFGSWERALAAYNWGPTNAEKWIAAGESFAALPGETQDYISNITGDVPV